MEQMRIHVAGARGPAADQGNLLPEVALLEKRHSVTIQFFRADRVFGAEHLVSAAEKAVRAMDNGTNMARTLGMEMLLYVAAERQTSEALRKLGIFPGAEQMALVIVGNVSADSVLEELGLERDDSVLDPAGKDPSVFGIPAGTENAPDLVLERVAVSEVFR